ncbi:MAG: hypothetical protein ACJKTH_03045 [Patescibacteria group bacterium UBA2163]
MNKEYITYIVGGVLSVFLGVGLWFGGQALSKNDIDFFKGNTAGNLNNTPQQNVQRNDQAATENADGQQSEVDLDRMGAHISGFAWEHINGDASNLTLNSDGTFEQGNDRGAWDLYTEESPDGAATIVFMRFDGNKNGKREFAVFEVTTNTFTIGNQDGEQFVYERIIP